MNLEKLRVAVNKLNLLLNNPDKASSYVSQEGEFDQQVDQLLSEIDSARSPQRRVMRISHRSSEK